MAWKVTGPDIGRPQTAPLGSGLFEIRAKGREGVARSVFCMNGREIVVLITVVKKASKLAARHLELARKRMRELHEE